MQKHLEREAKVLATLQLAHQADLLREDKQRRQLARLLFLRQQPYGCAQVIGVGIDSGVVKPDAESYRLISNCYIAARDDERALEPLAKAGELATDGDMYMLLGQMYLQRERFAPAVEALEKALAKAKPDQRRSFQLLIGVARMIDTPRSLAKRPGLTYRGRGCDSSRARDTSKSPSFRATTRRARASTRTRGSRRRVSTRIRWSRR